MSHTVFAHRRAVRIALAGVGALLAVLVLAQLLLPRIAADRVRSRVQRYGTVLSAHVSAFPAIQLLWGHAQSASVRVRDVNITPTQLVDLLSSARGIHSLDIAAEGLRVGPLALRDASLRKRGSALYAQGDVEAAQLRALPGGLEVQPLESSGGSVRVRATGGLFGVSASLAVLVSPQQGKLVAQPEGIPFAQFARVTLFSDPRLSIQALGASAQDSNAGADAQPLSWLVTLRAQLR